MVEVDPQPAVADPLDHLGEAAKQPLVGDALVVEGRQHQHAAAAQLHSAAAQLDGVGEGAGACARHHALGRQPRLDQRLQQRDLLGDRQRVALGVGAKHRQPDILLQQPAAVVDEARRIWAQIAVERCHNWR